jgi:hypothetical protein
VPVIELCRVSTLTSSLDCGSAEITRHNPALGIRPDKGVLRQVDAERPNSGLCVNVELQLAGIER